MNIWIFVIYKASTATTSVLSKPLIEKKSCYYNSTSSTMSDTKKMSKKNGTQVRLPWHVTVFHILIPFHSEGALRVQAAGGGPRHQGGREDLSAPGETLTIMMCRYLFSLLQCVKRVWAYLKEHKLMDPENKQWFTPDKTMAPIFGEEKIKGFGMMKYLKVSAMLRDPNSVVRGFLFTEPPVSDACQRTQVMSPLFLVVPSPNTVLMFHFWSL